MPMLREITIKVQDTLHQLRPIVAPLLQRVTLEMEFPSWRSDERELATWLAEQAPCVLSSLLLTSREPRVELLVVSLQNFASSNWHIKAPMNDYELVRGLLDADRSRTDWTGSFGHATTTENTPATNLRGHVAPVHVDPVQALPVELLGEIFSLLSFRGRLAVSHVSPSWRKIALSILSLWAEYNVCSDPRVKRTGTIFSVMLHRSNPLPFRFTYTGLRVPSSIAELVITNMHRMETLWLGTVNEDVLSHLLAQPAPMLTDFAYVGFNNEPILLPARWSSSLRHLSLSRSLFQPGTIFTALRKLHGFVPQGLDGPVPLDTTFPNLTEVRFYAVTRASLAVLVPLPPLLESLILSSSGGILDYSGVFGSYCPPHLRTLNITAVELLSCIFDLFLRIVNGPWAMRIDHQSKITLTAPGSGVVFEVSSDDRWLSREPHIADSWALLRDLTLGLRVFQEIYRNVQPHCVLPSLVSLTISDMRVPDAADAFLDRGTRLIAAPSLESITYRSESAEPARCLSLFSQVANSFSAPGLISIFVYTDTVELLAEGDLSELARLSERLVINDSGGETVCVLLKGEKQESV
ncbi:hypothetical protein AURDEDRAFT_168120 [Auricularia subglabra TFB-10046 SS5]|nr:hypothetical protein AURDEDRAFT_168120 [Auricularia subglabra TFB-10046 SS5]